MPFVRISLLRGRSPAQLRAIADGVHQALITAYAIPPEDRFQVIEQCAPEEFFYDPDYLGMRRSDQVVFVHIVAGNWRATAAKQALFAAIAENLVRDAGMRAEDVQVILSPNGRDEWSFGNGLASYIAAHA
ncbi:MAG: tautomerase family protein [Rhodospirillales bacterium]|nr:tautomerase family protein [Rhodospirillales bacterium]